MARRGGMRHGMGSRRWQSVYVRDPATRQYLRDEDGKLKVSHRVWKGHDWVHTPDGERHRVEASVPRGATREDLDAELKRRGDVLLHNWDAVRISLSNIFPPPPRVYPTLNEVIEAWLDSSATNRQSAHGQGRKVRSLWNNHVRVPVGVARIALGDAEAYIVRSALIAELDLAVRERRSGYRWLEAEGRVVEVEKEPMSPAQWAHLQDFLRSVFAWGGNVEQRDWTGIEGNPAAIYVSDRSKTERVKPPPAVVDVEQVLALLAFAKGYDRPLCALAALVAVGERPNAMRSLEWDRVIDADARLIRLDGQWVMHAGERNYVPPKNKRAKILAVPEPLWPYVTCCKGWSERWIVPTGQRSYANRALSQTATGERWGKLKTAYNAQAAPRLKVPEHLDIYHLKHSMATAARAAGYTDEQIGTAMGVSTQMVREHYAQATLAMRKQVLDAVFPSEIAKV